MMVVTDGRGYEEGRSHEKEHGWVVMVVVVA